MALNEGDMQALLAWVDGSDRSPFEHSTLDLDSYGLAVPPDIGDSGDLASGLCSGGNSPSASILSEQGSTSQDEERYAPTLSPPSNDVSNCSRASSAPPSTTTPIETSTPAPQKSKRKRNPANSSTQLQRRKRAEIEALRGQVTELQAYLARLKNREADSTPSSIAGHSVLALTPMAATEKRSGSLPSLWHELALMQYRARQRSELTNRKLKSILATQQQTNNAIRALLNKPALLQVR